MTARPAWMAAGCVVLAVTGTASAGTLDDMRRAGRFAICAAPDALPFSSREPGPPGFQLELGEQIARGLGLDFEVTWIKSKEYAGRAGCDAFMSAASLPEDAAERAEAGTAPASRRFPRLLTRPYLPVRFVLVAPVSRDDIRELDDLRTGHVAVPSGSWAHYVLNERGIPVRVRFTTDAEILAAVAAGITMSFTERGGGAGGQSLAMTRIRRGVVWDTVQFVANGIIFVILGEQMPSIMARAAEVVAGTSRPEVWWLAVYVFAIVAALAALRFIWVWTSLKLTLFRRRHRGPPPKVGLRLTLVMSLAGVRGAITLAGILTLPFVLADGSPMPSRNLAIFLAAGVIIVSLLVATIALPRLLKNVELPPEPSHEREEDRGRVAAASAALRAIEDASHAMAEGKPNPDLYSDIASRIMEVYRQRIETHTRTEEDDAVLARRIDDVERRLRLAGLAAERDELGRMARARQIDEATARKMIREVDLQELRYL